MNEYELDAIGAEKLINESHHPDLCERLIETHRTLQMSREYLLGIYPHGHRAINEIDISMVNLENAIELLKNTP